MAEQPTGSGGLVCTPHMSALIAKAGNGVLPSFEGGQELRDRFREATGHFNPEMLNEFALMCYVGYLEGVKKVRIFLFYFEAKCSRTSTRLWRLGKRLR